MSMSPLALSALLLPGLAYAGGSSSETVFCIADSTQLKAAFTQMSTETAAGTTPATYRILVQQGVYFPPNLGMIGGPDSPAPSIELHGGYGPGCYLRELDPANTLLNLGSQDDAPQIGFTTRGDVTVEGLSLISAYPSGQTAANDVLALRQAKGSLRRQHWSIRQTLFQGKAAQADANPLNGAVDLLVGAVDTPPVSVYVENVMAKGFGDGKCVFHYQEAPQAIPIPGHELAFAHNTIAYNGTCGIRAEALDNDSRVVLANNVIADNSGASLRTLGHADSPLELHNNTLTTAKFVGTHLALERNTEATNPSLLSYDNPIPAAGSHVINSGTTYLPHGLPANEFNGYQRWLGSRPDRGARETDVDDTIHYVVTAAGDSGPGSLRAAVDAANADSGPARIMFNIIENGSPACPAVIELNDQLMVTDDIIVDGFSQPGSSPNTLEDGDNAKRCIVLDGGLKDNAAFRSYDGSTDLMVIRGMEFGGFGPNDIAIHASGPDEFLSYGNRFGSELPVIENWSPKNGTAIETSGSKDGINSTDFASVGSLRDLGARNVFNENVFAAIFQRSRSKFLSNVIQSPMWWGDISMFDVADGGSIAANKINSKIDIAAEDAEAVSGLLHITNNSVIANESTGIEFYNRSENGRIRRVLVEENDLGTWTWLAGTNANGERPTEVTFSRNATHADGIAFSLSDDREQVSQNGNDVVQSFFLKPANGGLNFPVLETAGGGILEGEVSGSLQTRTGKYVVEVFASDTCDESGHGDGEELIGIGTAAVQDTGTENGVGPFQIAVVSPQSLSGRSITATATDEYGNTSEFSACVLYAGPPMKVFRDGFE